MNKPVTVDTPNALVGDEQQLEALLRRLDGCIHVKRMAGHRAFSPETLQACFAILREMMPTAPTAVPYGFALVPLKPTQAMEEVMASDDWQWQDLLAAANAITEQEYGDLASQHPADPHVASGEAQLQFAQALLESPEANEALRKAADSQRRLIAPH